MPTDENLVATIKNNYEKVNEVILKSSRKHGREQNAIKLITVTKKKSADVIKAAIEAGITRFGENYPEETEDKIEVLGKSSGSIEWHMIGHLQSRKSSIVAKHFDMMHSLDSVRLAGKLGKALDETGRSLPVLLEMNVSGEDSKGGWTAWDANRWDELIPEIEQIFDIDSLHVNGLMTMPPLLNDPEEVRPYFIMLRNLRDWLRKRFPKSDWNELSMGTSADFEVAVEEGATFVRIGTAILGPRLG